MDDQHSDAPFVEVALDAWFADRRTTLTYRAPQHLDASLEVGQLIWVPLRRRLVLGVVVERHGRTPVGATPRDVHALVEPAFCLTPLQWRLASWISEQTLSTLFESAALMFPPGASDRAVEHLSLVRTVSDSERHTLPALQRRLIELLEREGEVPLARAQKVIGSSLTGVMRELEQAGFITRIARVQHRTPPVARPKQRVRLVPGAEPPGDRAERQREAFAWLSARLRARPDLALPLEEVLASSDHGIDRRTLHALAKRGLVAIEEVPHESSPPVASVRDIVLTTEQQIAWQALESVLDSPTPERVLIHGVTGSGKTELYLRACARVLNTGRSVVVLAPEIALSGQIAARFRERFGDRALILHSALDDRERSANWERCRSGDPLVVVGPRSALFATLPHIGALIIDEEHEPAYKQDAAPRYHARAVAGKLAELHRAALVLGSATPDVETYHVAEHGDLRRITMLKRVGQRIVAASGELLAAPIPLPETRIVDMRAELRSGNATLFSRDLLQTIENRIAAGQQVILFLNRRGASTLVQCRACGSVSRCPYCDIPLVYHRVGERVVCHRCGYRAVPPRACSQCGSTNISYYGAGAQRVETEVSGLFPHARVLRWDQDALRRGVRHEDLLRKVARHEVDILVGTQMIAKGLDLPGIGAVGVVNADTFLYLPDFRAAERTFQVLTQVAGRAARRVAGGEVIIQTYSAEHYAIAAAANHDYMAFYREEIAFRRRHGYPPFRRLIRLLYRHADESEARAEAERVAALVIDTVDALPGEPDVDVIGPAPAFTARLRGRYGWQILVRGADGLTTLRDLSLGSGWIVDVDPMSLL
ncbi:MAG: primosomal protein N' [Chloroflexi bacterium]|nr:MAG: primosomal protein N' [Chloroflexota bacterium]